MLITKDLILSLTKTFFAYFQGEHADANITVSIQSHNQESNLVKSFIFILLIEYKKQFEYDNQPLKKVDNRQKTIYTT